MKAKQTDQKRKSWLPTPYFWDSLIGAFEEQIAKRRRIGKEKVLFHDNAPCFKVISTIAKLSELHFDVLPHPQYFLDLAATDDYMFTNLKKIFAGKWYDPNEEVIVETETYFEGLDKSFHGKGIHML